MVQQQWIINNGIIQFAGIDLGVTSLMTEIEPNGGFVSLTHGSMGVKMLIYFSLSGYYAVACAALDVISECSQERFEPLEKRVR